jgi:hypothetical protein
MPTKDGKSPVRTVTADNKPFVTRLRKYYKPQDYVRVINIDNVPIYWHYFPVDGEETYFTDDGVMRVTEGRQHFDEKREELLPGNDQAWMLNPGESEVLLGANADLFIQTLYKTLVAKKTIKAKPNMKEGQARKYNWIDGNQQEQIIEKIFLGVEKPQFGEVNEPARLPAAK